jgi:deoxycytidylate deaminase
MTQPPQDVIDVAVIMARQSPCAKSKRGVALYIDDVIFAGGFNGPPGDERCLMDAWCRAVCADRCSHAEARAIRNSGLHTFVRATAVHVKLDGDDKLVAGGPPSCRPCARDVLDIQLAGFWLYEADKRKTIADPTARTWRLYTAREFYDATMKNAPLPKSYEREWP